MKKNLKRGFLLVTMLGAFLFSMNNVNAGSLNVNLNADSSVEVNKNINITVALSNIEGANDGIGSIDSTFEYNSEYFELVSAKEKCSMYIGINEVTTGKIKQAGFATNEGLTGSEISIWEITLKAKTVGNTDIELNNIKVKDGFVNLLTSQTVLTKNITITSPAVETTEVIKNVVETTNVNDSVNTNENNEIIETVETIEEEIINEETQEEIETQESEGFFATIAKYITNSINNLFKKIKKISFTATIVTSNVFNIRA